MIKYGILDEMLYMFGLEVVTNIVDTEKEAREPYKKIKVRSYCWELLFTDHDGEEEIHFAYFSSYEKAHNFADSHIDKNEHWIIKKKYF